MRLDLGLVSLLLSFSCVAAAQVPPDFDFGPRNASHRPSDSEFALLEASLASGEYPSAADDADTETALHLALSFRFAEAPVAERATIFLQAIRVEREPPSPDGPPFLANLTTILLSQPIGLGTIAINSEAQAELVALAQNCRLSEGGLSFVRSHGAAAEAILPHALACHVNGKRGITAELLRGLRQDVGAGELAAALSTVEKPANDNAALRRWLELDAFGGRTAIHEAFEAVGQLPPESRCVDTPMQPIFLFADSAELVELVAQGEAIGLSQDCLEALQLPFAPESGGHGHRFVEIPDSILITQ